MTLLNVGCGTHYAQGWVNTDVWEDETTKPDVRVVAGQPYPFEENTFDAAYLGHVLEHMSWESVPFFLEDISRVVKPGAPMLFVGPDVFKTIIRWSKKEEPWTMVLSTLEHLDMNYQPGREHLWWDGAHHYWNCHEQRVVTLLEKTGFVDIQNVFDLIPNDPNGTSWQDQSGFVWPVVGKYHWQFALKCSNK